MTSNSCIFSKITTFQIHALFQKLRTFQIHALFKNYNFSNSCIFSKITTFQIHALFQKLRTFQIHALFCKFSRIKKYVLFAEFRAFSKLPCFLKIPRSKFILEFLRKIPCFFQKFPVQKTVDFTNSVFFPRKFRVLQNSPVFIFLKKPQNKYFLYKKGIFT